jgi:hypothetical protein
MESTCLWDTELEGAYPGGAPIQPHAAVEAPETDSALPNRPKGG